MVHLFICMCKCLLTHFLTEANQFEKRSRVTVMINTLLLERRIRELMVGLQSVINL